ncbi:hypothetical protein CPC08DRAFT_103494 [Agrocybe pediades]|nr:hypothetical protein CPC08DRAFT_103494 [Agrocybe pediades]
MSSSSNDALPSDAVQRAINSAYLNAGLLYVFLMGAYTTLYPATIYVYLKKYQSTALSQKRLMIGTLTALYAVVLGQISINCFYLNLIFLIKGDSKLSSFIEAVTITSTPDKPGHALVFLNTISFVIADGIMVWRCFHVCGRSLRGFAWPMCF